MGVLVEVGKESVVLLYVKDAIVLGLFIHLGDGLGFKCSFSCSIRKTRHLQPKETKHRFYGYEGILPSIPTISCHPERSHSYGSHHQSHAEQLRSHGTCPKSILDGTLGTLRLIEENATCRLLRVSGIRSSLN